MGNRHAAGFGASQRYFEGWLTGGRMANVPTTGGTYTIAPLEQFVAEPGRPTLQALRVSDGTTLWIEYRIKLGVDMFELPTTGVLIYQEVNGPTETHLLDMTPGSVAEDRLNPTGKDLTDAALSVGQTLVNPLGHLKITVNWTNSTGANLTIAPA
jgi:hypothetical protein